MLFVSTVYAKSSAPIFRVSLETIAYPSQSSLAKECDKKVFQSAEQMKTLGYGKEINALIAAYNNKDIIWKTAQDFLAKIQQGEINQANINDYICKDKITCTKQHNEVNLAVDKIQSYSNKALLSVNNKGYFPDRMFVKKNYNEENAIIRVIDFLHGKDAKAIGFITLTYSAKIPFKNWALINMQYNKFEGVA